LEARYPRTPAGRLRAPGTGLERYAAVLPASEGALARAPLESTPLWELTTRAGGGPRVFGKDEGANPTGSAKDPLAVTALACLLDRGVRELVFTSTGNTAASFAWALEHFPEISATLLAADGFPVPADPPANLGIVRVPGDYAAAHQHARRAARARGVHCEEGFFSVGRREGLKTAYLDAMLTMPDAPTVVVQSISSGMGLLAADRAVDHLVDAGILPVRPRLIGVQQATCAPMASAFAAGSPVIRTQDRIADPTGICVATLLGDPTPSYPDVRRVVAASDGAIVAVPDAAAIAARSTLVAAGLDPCMASAMAVAGVDEGRARGLITQDDCVLVMLSGASRSTAGSMEAGALRHPPRGKT
jgi:threonine synthase